MKKVFQSAIVLSLFLLSCTDSADMTERITGAVRFRAGFVVSAEGDPTRVAVLTGLESSGFQVSAYATGTESWASVGSATTPGLMHKQAVTWTGSAWTYSPIRPWPGNGKVSFFAWNDVGTGLSVSLSTTPGPPQLTYTVPDNQSGQNDLVVADALDQTVNTNNGDVALTFNHILSRIGFKARLDGPYPGTITITSLEVRYADDAVQSKGTYTFGSGWNLSGTDWMSHTGDEVVATGGVALTESPQPVNDADKYLMLLPQEVSDGDVTIEVKWRFDDDGGGGYVSYDQIIPLPKQIWLPGKCYNYNLTVSMGDITLDPVLIDPWGAESLYNACTITYKTPDGTDIVEYRTTNVSYPVGDYTFPLYPDFDGWNTKADGTGRTYRAGEYISCTGDLPLFAQWTGRTNCYMVKPGETVKFRVSRAYKDDGASTTLRNGAGTHNGTFTIEEIWDPDNLVTATVDNGSGSDAVITVTAASGSGNALVAIKAGSDIAWSYHIWVTTYEGDNTVTMMSGIMFMDRNLGATTADLEPTAYGLLYQWGRKDPFLNSESPKTAATSNEKGTIEYTIKNPDTFLTGVTASSWDWHFSNRDNYLWDEQTTGNKTIYDPCPAGWRVPAYRDAPNEDTSPWYEYQETSLLAENGAVWSNTGYVFTHKDGTRTYYPTSDFLTPNASFDPSNPAGNYWSAGHIDKYGAILFFEDGTIIANVDNERSWGLSVRCVREQPSP